MIECSDTLVDYLLTNNVTLYLYTKPTGCTGNSILFYIVENHKSAPNNFTWYDYDYFISVCEDLQKALPNLHLYVDYLNEPLFKGIHVSIKKADNICGCGKSFN